MEWDCSSYSDDGIVTNSSKEQKEVENSVKTIYAGLRDNDIGVAGGGVCLLRDKHVAYLKKGIRHLSEDFDCLEASQPWLCYWILHSLSLLHSCVPPSMEDDVASFLSRCQSPEGGFGGGPGQLPHLATTYSAVLTLCTLSSVQAYQVIDRPSLQRFLLRMHQANGSYIMHADGEEDIRGVYCGLVSAVLTNLLVPELTKNTEEWLSSCQTYEGGFSAVPGTEAHGGYTFCGFASLVVLNRTDLCDLQALLRWVTRKQMKVEGGFQGRTNKLVDGCYSFWQGGVFPLLYKALEAQNDDNLNPELWQFNQEALQEYLLYCCQCAHGGLIDKPGKFKDYYHTCYCLSGLSISQHCFCNLRTVNITGETSSVLKPTHPVFNITLDKIEPAQTYFSQLPIPKLLKTTEHGSH